MIVIKQENGVYQASQFDGLKTIRAEEAVNLIMRQLTKRFGEACKEVHSTISELPLEDLEDLGEALLDFRNLADLQDWLMAK
jgi:hypothetical protein